METLRCTACIDQEVNGSSHPFYALVPTRWNTRVLKGQMGSNTSCFKCYGKGSLLCFPKIILQGRDVLHFLETFRFGTGEKGSFPGGGSSAADCWAFAA